MIVKCDCVEWSCIARVDVDAFNGRPGCVQRTGDVRRTIDALRFMLDLAGGMDQLDGVRFRLTRTRTANGWHVRVWSDRLRLSPAETVALQAILGSDWRREGFMLVRATGLHRVPPAWRLPFRWNPFYSYHHRGSDMVSRADFGGNAFKPEHLRGAKASVLTISDVEERDIPAMKGQPARKAIVLEFAEFPDTDNGKGGIIPAPQFWCNKTDAIILIDSFGENEKAWIGKQVPVMVVTNQNPTTKEYTDVVHVAPVTRWDELKAKFGRAVTRVRGSASQTTTKRGRGR